MRLLLFLLLLGVITAGTARGERAVVLQAESAFSGMTPHGVFPVAVTIHNSGASVDGLIIVRTESFTESARRYIYPVSLPSGALKRIVTYPTLDRSAQNIVVSFSGPASVDDIKLPLQNRFESPRQVGMIGDQTGGLAVLSTVPPPDPKAPAYSRPTAPYSDCYALPQDAPERSAGYQGLSVLVLGDGAERMTLPQWAAIRHWVMMGGSLIMLGGAGAVYTRVPDAQAFLPIDNPQGAVVHNLSIQGFNHAGMPDGDVAIMSGKLKPGCAALAEQNGNILLATNHLGAGSVLFAAFNPLEKPLRGWTGQLDLWNDLIRRASPTLAAPMLRSVAVKTTAFDQYSGGYPYGATGGPAPEVNPFRIQLPPLDKVVWIFLAYFILVIPVSYLVLKRLKRLELAWITSPLLSLAFAFAFYLFTADLYKAGLSRRTAGVVVATAGSAEARFAGFSELFLPLGGSYKIAPPDAEMLETAAPEEDDGNGYGGYRQTQQTQDFDSIDFGAVAAPDFRVANLAFERLYHTQPVSLHGAVTAQIARGSGDNITGSVHNGTDQTLVNVAVVLPGAGVYSSVDDLKPGETKPVGPTDREYDIDHRREYETKLKAWRLHKKGSPPHWAGASGLFDSSPLVATLLRMRGSDLSYPGAFLVANMNGDVLGPQLGKYVGGDRSVNLLVSLPLEGGGHQ